MALHPFHSFRKHQRAIFAGLTIVCMLSFVMSTGIAGVGDGFSWLQQLLTGSSSKYPQAAKLFGKSVDLRELNRLREQRLAANRYMVYAISASHNLILRDVETILPQLDPQAQNQVRRIIQTRQFALDPRYAQFGLGQQYERDAQQFEVDLFMIEQSLTKANKTPDAEKIRLLRAAISGDRYLLRNPKDDLYPGSDLYFGGAVTTEGLLDFKIWQSEADRLGIYLSSDDILRSVQDESLGRLTNEDGLAIERAITPRGQQVKPDFVAALGEEFRVRLAQTTLIGFDPGGIMHVPAPVTPAELWDYYRRHRTELAVKLLPIPVSKFIDQVKEKPAESELTKLFEEYKNLEYHPQRDTPAFKQSRRIKLEWVGARPDAPRYRKEARKWILSALASTPGNPWLAMALLDPVISEYDRVSRRTPDGSLRIASWTAGGFALSYETYAHFQRAESAAALIGQIAGVSIQGNPLGAFMATQAAAHGRESKTQEAAIAAETRNRAPSCVSLIMAGTAPSPVLVMCGLYQVLEAKEFSLPLEAVKNKLIARLEEDLAKDTLNTNLAAFRKELEATKGKAAEAEKVIDKFVKEGGWEHAASTTFDDVWNLAQNPKVAKLKEAYIADHFEDLKARNFPFQFFSGEGGRTQPKLYAPEEIKSRSDDTTFLFWRTADEPAKTLTFEQAKPLIEKAWRFQKARELAKQEAEKIAKQSPSDPLPALLDAAKKLGETPFDLFGVAYLQKSLQSQATMGGSDFQAYRVPEDKIEFPPIDFVEKLMAPGTAKSTVVLANQPKSIEYVAVVINRLEPTVKDFQRDTSPIFRQNPMLTQVEQDKRLAYRFAVIAQLREKAGAQINEAMAKDQSSSSEDDS